MCVKIKKRRCGEMDLFDYYLEQMTETLSKGIEDLKNEIHDVCEKLISECETKDEN